MKTLYLSLLVSMLTFSISAQTKDEKLQQLLQAYSQLGKLNGTVLITQNNKIVLEKGYGLRDVATSLPNDPNTIFQIGSVTKQFTATVILKLQEMKKLNVEDKLSKYLPDYPNSRQITIDNLLTHTSGIFNYTDDLTFLHTQAMKPITQEQMLAVFKDKPLKFAPGTNWEYSNSNYILLGYIIEKVTHKTYQQAVTDMILKPLGMKSTYFDAKSAGVANRAIGYEIYSQSGSKESVEFDPSVSFAAGTLLATAGDLDKWNKAMSQNKIISKTSFERMTTPVKSGYGYGVYVDKINGKKMLAHGGLAFGYTSYLANVPEDGVSIVILNNIVNYAITDIAKDVLAILYDQPYKIPEAIKEITLSPEVLSKYVGTYEIAPQFSIAITVEGTQLYAQATGQGKLPLSVEKEDSFFLKGTEIKVNFNKDAAGIVNELILFDGKPIPGKKVK